MNIAVVGLGLIGGSVCKALKANTFHHIMGMDTDKETVRKALEQGAIDEEIDESRLGEANLTVVALYPVPTVEFVKKNADFGLYDNTWAGFLFMILVLVVVMQIFEKIKNRMLDWTMD